MYETAYKSVVSVILSVLLSTFVMDAFVNISLLWNCYVMPNFNALHVIIEFIFVECLCCHCYQGSLLFYRGHIVYHILFNVVKEFVTARLYQRWLWRQVRLLLQLHVCASRQPLAVLHRPAPAQSGATQAWWWSKTTLCVRDLSSAAQALLRCGAWGTSCGILHFVKLFQI